MKNITCVCLTYHRAELLPRAIESFLRQDYSAEHRRLIILDDAGQYRDGISGDGWQIISVDQRFQTLGEKRNACIKLAVEKHPQTEALAVWDDDDIYLPHHLSACDWALDRSEWSRPSKCFAWGYGGLETKSTGKLFHACWAFTRGAYVRAGGYPAINSGEDQGFADSMGGAGIVPADPIEQFEPSFLMGWQTGSYHISAMGGDAYSRLSEREPGERITEVVPAWEKDWGEVAGVEGGKATKQWVVCK